MELFFLEKINNKKLIIIKLKGGLGNQMFQYAVARILGEKNKDSVFIDNEFYKLGDEKSGYTKRNFELEIFKNSYNFVPPSQIVKFTRLTFFNKWKKKVGLNYPQVYTEKNFSYNPEFLMLKSPVFLNGYFQSYKYFLGYEKLIKNIFEFPLDKLDEINLGILHKIKMTDTISLHIRRGDFVSNKKIQSFHGNCSMDYYLEAINTIASSLINDFQLVFFSDDIKWVKDKFGNLPYPKLFIDHNEEKNSWKDMFLMSCCSHNIIANSSFSWWAAWLNNNSNKIVVAPARWFANKATYSGDIIPHTWTKL